MEIVGNEDNCAAFLQALAVCQGQVQGAVKNQHNPFFGSQYSDLASVWAACRDPLSANGLSVVFMPQESAIKLLDYTENVTKDVRGKKQSYERQASVTTITLLILVSHRSGAYMVQPFSCDLPFSADIQKVGAAIRYLCRYSLSAIVGIPQVDDDGESLAAEGAAERMPPAPPAKTITAVQTRILDDLVAQSGAPLEKWLEFFSVARLNDLTAVQFKSAVERLNRKIQEHKTQGTTGDDNGEDRANARDSTMETNATGQDHGEQSGARHQQPPAASEPITERDSGGV